jgi:hypothetical protein
MALSEPIEGLIIYPACFLTVRSSGGLTHNIFQLNAGIPGLTSKIIALADGQGTLRFIPYNSQVLPECCIGKSKK